MESTLDNTADPGTTIINSANLSSSTTSSTSLTTPSATPKRGNDQQPPLRRFKRIPCFIVENHNDVLEYIYRCLGARYLPFQDGTFLHFDSHPDMTVPRHLPASNVRHKERLLDALSIENWIMPTVYAGHFDRIVWCKAPWCQQMPIGDQRFIIGAYADVIHVSSPLEYFVSEGSYRPAEDMAHTRPVLLRTVEVPAPAATLEQLQTMLLKRHATPEAFVLDIDLDFFSTRNPFRDLYPLAQIHDLMQSVFEYERPAPDADEARTLFFSRERLNQLDDLERIFEHLLKHDGSLAGLSPACHSVEQAWPQLEMLCDRLRKTYAPEPIDWPAVYNAGCTMDSRLGDLPHHESTDAELDEYVGYFEAMLSALLPAVPTVVTIARSSLDDYCPVAQVDGIQKRVWEALQRVYGERLAEKPILHYLDEEWTV